MPYTKIDTTTPDSWAKTWVRKMRDCIPDYKAMYSAHDLMSDMFIGELPWDETQIAVVKLIPEQLGFQEMLDEWKDTFGNDFLAINFGVIPGLSQPDGTE